MPVTPIQRLADAVRALWCRIVRLRAPVTAPGPATDAQMTALRRELQRRLGDKIE